MLSLGMIGKVATQRFEDAGGRRTPDGMREMRAKTLPADT